MKNIEREIQKTIYIYIQILDVYIYIHIYLCAPGLIHHSNKVGEILLFGQIYDPCDLYIYQHLPAESTKCKHTRYDYE